MTCQGVSEKCVGHMQDCYDAISTGLVSARGHTRAINLWRSKSPSPKTQTMATLLKNNITTIKALNENLNTLEPMMITDPGDLDEQILKTMLAHSAKNFGRLQQLEQEMVALRNLHKI